MLKITLFAACLYAVSLAPSSGFVVETVETVTDLIDVEGVDSTKDNPIISCVADQPETKSNFVNSKQFVLATTEKVNWYRAAHICKFNGMELATIESMEEHRIVSTLINMSGCNDAEYFWISGNDLGVSREWYWLANGKPMSFTYWGRDEPNNSNERCVELRFRSNDWSWNDRSCNVELFFVCEMKF